MLGCTIAIRNSSRLVICRSREFVYSQETIRANARNPNAGAASTPTRLYRSAPLRCALPVVATNRLTEHHATTSETPSTPVIDANRANGTISSCEFARKFHGNPVSIQPRRHSNPTHASAHCSGHCMRYFRGILRNRSHASANPAASCPGNIFQQNHTHIAG